MRTPIVWHVWGAYGLQIWGVGVVRIVFSCLFHSAIARRALHLRQFGQSGTTRHRFLIVQSVLACAGSWLAVSYRAWLCFCGFSSDVWTLPPDPALLPDVLPLTSCSSATSWELETGSANRGTAIVPLSTIGTRYGNSVSTRYASKTNGTTQPQLAHHGRESKKKADTEIQYRRRIIDADVDCGPRSRDSYVLRQHEDGK